MPTGIPKHKLSNVRDLVADCAHCGLDVPIKLKGGKPRCVESIKDSKKTAQARVKAREHQNTYYQKNKERILAAQKQPHGLTITEAQEYRNGKSCEVCGDSTSEALCVDHDHITGEIRGVLCRKHNTALAMFGDSEEMILKCLEYLRKVSG